MSPNKFVGDGEDTGGWLFDDAAENAPEFEDMSKAIDALTADDPDDDLDDDDGA